MIGQVLFFVKQRLRRQQLLCSRPLANWQASQRLLYYARSRIGFLARASPAVVARRVTSTPNWRTWRLSLPKSRLRREWNPHHCTGGACVRRARQRHVSL